MLRLAFAACAALAVLAVPAVAQKRADELVEIRDGALQQLRSDKAYILFRIPQVKGASSLEPLFLRKPSSDEIARFEQAKANAFAAELPDLTRAHEREVQRAQRRGEPAPPPPSMDTFNFVWEEVQNLQDVDYSDTFARTDNEHIYLVETPPGDYVLYGMSPAMGLPRIAVCFCLGTVGFTAQPGQITDIGYVIGDYAKMRSVVPELAAETGYGPSSDVGAWVLTAGTVRPPRGDSIIPAALADETVIPVTYRAVGKFFTPNAMGINRLVPVPGVLDYDRGKVIDVATGEIAPDNF